MNAECIAFAQATSSKRLPGQTRAGKYVRLNRVGRVAQVVEQRPFKAWVAGSNPAALTNLRTESTGPLCEGLYFVRKFSPLKSRAVTVNCDICHKLLISWSLVVLQ